MKLTFGLQTKFKDGLHQVVTLKCEGERAKLHKQPCETVRHTLHKVTYRFPDRFKAPTIVTKIVSLHQGQIIPASTWTAADITDMRLIFYNTWVTFLEEKLQNVIQQNPANHMDLCTIVV